ncbi:hypothetical protein [Prosthecobacter sp.]|uniref:hypothetical protein n=1 Tax=Prosthecobacter sp. TaxID=1965333 RepID=UPI0037851433
MTMHLHRCLLVTLVLAASSGFSQEAKAPPRLVSPLARIRKVWNGAVADDIKKGKKDLADMDAEMRRLVPAGSAQSAAPAVEAAWKLRPKAQAALDDLIGKIHAYNTLAYEFKAKNASPDGPQEGGVIDLLFVGGIPLEGSRWESLRPLLLPVKPPEFDEKSAPWSSRPRVLKWKESETKGMTLGDLGWATPEADSEDWKQKSTRWIYDFSILHLWLAQPPAGLGARVKSDWLKQEAGLEDVAQWKQSPDEPKLMLNGDYPWMIKQRPARSKASRLSEVNLLVCPEKPAGDTDALLKTLAMKNAVLHCLAESVLARGPAPEAGRWLDCAAHANPPWTCFEPERTGDGAVGAWKDAVTLVSKTGRPFQLQHQVAAFQNDFTWRPAVQGWTGYIPLPAKRDAPATTRPTAAPEALKAPPRPLDKAWSTLCDLAAGEIAKAAPGGRVRAAPPRIDGWWFAFPQENWARALKEKGLEVADDGKAVQVVLTDIMPDAGIRAQAMLDGRAVGAVLEVALPGPWPATFATPKEFLRVGLPLACLTLGLLVWLAAWKFQPRNQGDTWWQFFKQSPPAAACLLALVCTGTAWALWWAGPALTPLLTPVSGVVEIEVGAHKAVTPKQRQVVRSTCDELFTELSGHDSSGASTWLSRWWRAVKIGVFYEKEPRPTLAAADTTWRLRAVAAELEWVKQGLLREENRADFDSALKELDELYDDGEKNQSGPNLGPSLASGPTAGSTLAFTDGDDGDLQELPSLAHLRLPTDPVLTVLLCTPPTDPRTAVQSDIAFRQQRLKACSTRLMSPFPLGDGLTLKESLKQWPGAGNTPPSAAKAPLNMDTVRAEFWGGITDKDVAVWSKEITSAFIEQSRSDKSKDGPARLTTRFQGWSRWCVVALAAVGGSLLLSIALGRVLEWLRHFAAGGRSVAWIYVAAALAGWGLSFLAGTAALAALEPWITSYGGSLASSARVLAIGPAGVLALAFAWRRLLPEGRSFWVRSSQAVLRLASLVLGFMLAVMALAFGILLPLSAHEGTLWLPGGYSFALLLCVLLADSSFVLAAWGAGTSKKNAKGGHSARRATTWQ